jgi:hypothetical protein
MVYRKKPLSGFWRESSISPTPYMAPASSVVALVSKQPEHIFRADGVSKVIACRKESRMPSQLHSVFSTLLYKGKGYKPLPVLWDHWTSGAE